MSVGVKVAYDFVVAGAGVAGLATARYIAAAQPTARIAIVTAHAPMSQTSSMSTECFRDHWPSPAMRAFMARSIELMSSHAAESNAFRMARRGYLYASASPGVAAHLLSEANSCHGAAVRRFATPADVVAAGRAPYSSNTPDALGADVYTNSAAVRAAFPYLNDTIGAVLHARNAGWVVSAQTMGMDMLDALLARRGPDGSALTTVIRGRVVGADLGSGGDRVRAVHVAAGPSEAGDSSEGAPTRLACGSFINAAGPFLTSTHSALLSTLGGGSLPVRREVHAKVVFRDVLRTIPRDAPQLILLDRAAPMWSADEIEHLAETVGPAMAARASGVMSGGAHLRPYGGEGSDALLLLWEAWHHGIEADDPPPAVENYLERDLYPEVALRGLAHLVPSLAAYFDDDARASLVRTSAPGRTSHETQRPPFVDGGYYTKTEENHPLIGPAPGPQGQGSIAGATVCGALSGYGIMASHAAGELAAAYATGSSSLPLAYSPLLSPLRYQDAAFMRPGGIRDALIAGGGGQL